MPLLVPATPFNSSHFLLSYCNYVHARTTGPFTPSFRSTKNASNLAPKPSPPHPRLMMSALLLTARTPAHHHSIFLDIYPNKYSQLSKTTSPLNATPPHQCAPGRIKRYRARVSYPTCAPPNALGLLMRASAQDTAAQPSPRTACLIN